MPKRKNKQINKIVLIGFMGAGKTHIGKQLAKHIKWQHIDSDKILEKNEKRTISRIFKEDGEKYFRDAESQTIKDLFKKNNVVISLGGGSVCRKQNRNLITKKAFAIWLKSKPSTILRRIKKNKRRPLLRVDDPEVAIKDLLKNREAFYKECANITVNSDSDQAINSLKKIPEIQKLFN